MIETEDFEGEEISLFDLWEKLREGWRYVVGGVLVGVLSVVAALFVFPNQYEAIALLQVGQIGQVEQVGQVGSSVPVEPATQVVERMKSSAFQLKVAENYGDQEWINELNYSAASASQRLLPQLVKANSAQGAAALLEIRTRGKSRESARSLLVASVTELVKKHNELAKPQIERMLLDLRLAKEKQAKSANELNELGKLAASAGVKDERSIQLSLITSLRLQRENELLAHQQIIFRLERALSSPATESTKLIEDVFVGEKPVTPKKGLLLALGLLGGLLVGVMWVFVSGAWRKARERRSVSGLTHM